ncbi:MAG: hypothetical protein C6P37_07310 [Caldibacillus debilis]|jgi:hypothetical protein|uniref:Uncharacterized protein n=1 Tax=Caldibacillus debilis TaxID=301148 RepID=A0A3E0K586_9BACI|nr:hypothetical protein [Bacillaceae bacterium]OUM84073.1 MAG: hypothetical protein BAA03_07115 [Caldibacillus debilis]REJ15477.1 MAG: hypothetical protein C6W57_11360 [Caldibacillus debilis]REJ29037.1 MAG: hypothetical protein C6P37_07310 [Caldibacillus debilis]
MPLYFSIFARFQQKQSVPTLPIASFFKKFYIKKRQSFSQISLPFTDFLDDAEDTGPDRPHGRRAF